MSIRSHEGAGADQLLVADEMKVHSLSTPTTPRARIDLTAARRAMFRRWRSILIAVLVCVALAALYTMTQPRMYSASATGVVTVKSTGDVGGSIVGDNLAKSKATQYQALAKSRVVAEGALAIAGLPGDPNAAAAGVSVAVPIDTAQISVSVVRDNPADAARLANAWIQSLGAAVSRVENQEAPSSQGQPSSQASVTKVLRFVDAQVPSGPSTPNAKLNLLLGMLLGLVIGAVVALLQERSDRRIRSAEAVEKAFGLSVIGTLPLRSGGRSAKKKGTESESTVASRAFLEDEGTKTSKSDFRAVEAFKELRTNLQFMHPDNPPRVIVLTSPLPADGKSTVAANLALAMAYAGDDVVLVDGDLRRPTVAKSFNVETSVGLVNAVVGQADVEDLLQPITQTDKLKILGCGPIPPNPSEILASEAFQRLMRGLAEKSMVVIDAPPLIPVSDAAIIAARFDGAVVVIDAERSTTDALGKALGNLDKVRASVLGVVLNRVPTSKIHGSSYGYYYGGDYAYYYSSDAEAGSKNRSSSGKARRRRRSAKR